jgi:hypothetical protein
MCIFGYDNKMIWLCIFSGLAAISDLIYSCYYKRNCPPMGEEKRRRAQLYEGTSVRAN